MQSASHSRGTNLWLAETLWELGAVQFGKFTLGRTTVDSPVYVNLRLLIGHPTALWRAAHIIWDELQALQRMRHPQVQPFDLVAGVPFGGLHIATQILREIYSIFAEMGFQVYRSPEVESDAYNFELLNIPAHHPARDLWDTFFTTEEGIMLRTHTSPGQVRAMGDFATEPIRVVLPGMCYRYEQTDASHEFQFNQVELLAIGKNITFADLKGTLEDFAKRMYGQNVRTRFRPSYFPFVEPGGEMDIECFVCSGKGCSVCSRKGWLEILGCGMVHPVVLRNGGYDPDVYSGFAAGLGPERIAMLRYHIDDIRDFWANDVRFLEQFTG